MIIKNYLSNNKADQSNNPSFKSCMLRIPGTLNSKNNAQVQIIQKFNLNYIPKIDILLLRQVRLYLADLDLQGKIEFMQSVEKRKKPSNFYHDRVDKPKYYQWIERLLHTPLEEGRKYCLWKILCPYLMNVKHLSFYDAYYILKDWLNKCNEIRPLDFNPDYQIKIRLKNVSTYKPLSRDKLKQEHSSIYQILFN